MAKKIVFVVDDPTTEIGTGLGGENIVISFADGRFETDDIALADHLLNLGIAVEDPKKVVAAKPAPTEESE